MQEELLDKNPKADVRIYAVWFSMYPTDRRDRWSPDLLTDRRVAQWWDEDKTVGRWYMDHIERMEQARAADSVGYAGDILWDAYMVYGADATWEEAPTRLRKWGRTILRTTDDLRAAFDTVARNGKPSP